VTDVLVAVAMGVAAGVASGLFGVGGGVLFVPALTLLLGLSQLHAEATSLAALVPVVVAGAWRQRSYGNLRTRPAVVIGIASIVGVGGGAMLARELPDAVLRRLFGVFMLAIAGQLLWSLRSRAARRETPG
jgi:uncharacterized membrane protein YfcA